MRIGLDARYTTDHFPGIGRYTLSLAEALAEPGHDHTLVLIVDPRAQQGRYDPGVLAALPRVELAGARVAPFSAAQHLALPALARRLRLDVLHSPYYIKPYLGLPCPSVVTIYDLIGWRFPRTLSRRGRLLYRLSMALAVRTATRLITVSESARADIAHVYRLLPERIAVTPLAASHRFRPQAPEAIAAVRQRYHLPERYVLYVGSNKPHKNLERLVRAWRKVLEEAPEVSADVALVIAGHEDPRYGDVRRFVTEHQLEARVRFAPGVAEADLPALYSGATVFAFPSYYEGFGLPPLEAMACGVPVLCAYTSSLPEVVGDAALTVDPFNVHELAEGLARLLGNPGLRRTLSARGRRRASLFSWRRTALETLRVYESLG
ncbi:MAG: glycosyltransferase family 4 protein [Chloroflexaceae bacterium]